MRGGAAYGLTELFSPINETLARIAEHWKTRQTPFFITYDLICRLSLTRGSSYQSNGIADLADAVSLLWKHGEG